MPVVTTLPPAVNTFSTALRAAIETRFITDRIEEVTGVPDPGSPAQFVVDAVSSFQADLNTLEANVATLSITKANASNGTLVNATLDGNTAVDVIVANNSVGTLGQYLASGGANGTYWATFAVAGTPSLDAVATVSGNTSRAIAIANTLVAGNTTLGTLGAARTSIGPVAGSTSTGNQVGLEIYNNGGTGDSNVAAMSFHCTGTYGTHQHLRSDGYFGVGGWSASPWRWYVNLGNGDMTAAGNVTAYSDPRLKEDITPIKSALKTVMGWNGVKYRWTQNSALGTPGTYDYGILSPDIEKDAPELVKNSLWKSPDGDFYKTVVYDKLAPFLIEAIKEQQAIIDKQRETIAKMQQQIDAIITNQK